MDNSKKTYVFINLIPTWGGGEKWHFLNAATARKHGLDAVVICREGSELEKRCVAEELPCIALSRSVLDLFNPSVRKKLQSLFSSPETYVFVNGSKSVKLAAVCRVLFSPFKLFYRRGLPFPVKPTLMNRWIFGNFVTAVLVNGQGTVKPMEIICNRYEIPIRIIPNGLLIPDIKQEKSQPPVVIAAGRLEYQKGYDLLIRAWKSVAQQHPDVRLKIFGKGSEEVNLQRLINDLKLQRQVELPGFSPSLTNELQAARFFVLSSRWEGLPNVVQEAMANGLACIGFDDTAVAELVRPDENGLLVPAFETDKLAEAVIRLLDDPSLVKRMGQAARRIIEAEYDQDKVFERVREWAESF